MTPTVLYNRNVKRVAAIYNNVSESTGLEMNSRPTSYAEGKRGNYSYYTGAITDGSLCAHKFVLVLDWSAGIALALRCCQWERHRKAYCISLGDWVVLPVVMTQSHIANTANLKRCYELEW